MADTTPDSPESDGGVRLAEGGVRPTADQIEQQSAWREWFAEQRRAHPETGGGQWSRHSGSQRDSSEDRDRLPANPTSPEDAEQLSGRAARRLGLSNPLAAEQDQDITLLQLAHDQGWAPGPSEFDEIFFQPISRLGITVSRERADAEPQYSRTAAEVFAEHRARLAREDEHPHASDYEAEIEDNDDDSDSHVGEATSLMTNGHSATG